MTKRYDVSDKKYMIYNPHSTPWIIQYWQQCPVRMRCKLKKSLLVGLVLIVLLYTLYLVHSEKENYALVSYLGTLILQYIIELPMYMFLCLYALLYVYILCLCPQNTISVISWEWLDTFLISFECQPYKRSKQIFLWI